jgi:alpha-glucosidase
VNVSIAARAASVAARRWWQGAVVYQIYPRSFADSNGDGIGDLPGITARLDYVASLGVDAIWLSPFFKSPMKDFGYDVSDYCDVDPIFGTLTDFDQLVDRAHELGLRVIIDQVMSHTSDRHAWFRESRADRTNPKANWYVWADPKSDGTPPNNWQSEFGGPAWTWDARRGQYFLHNFLDSQPDLNVHEPAVQDALLECLEFWLKRGVDGFRLDAINYAMHDLELRDNPPAAPSGRPRSRSIDFQQSVYNRSHANIPQFLERIRALLDRYGDRFTVAEVGGPNAEPLMHQFTDGETRLNSAYGFNFLYAAALTPAIVKSSLEKWPNDPALGWPSWAFSNHDAPRAVSRWGTPEERDALARLGMLLLMCLRGNVFLYQGEELGLAQAQLRYEDLQDPEAIANWPLTLGRDGARTPMPWSVRAPSAGFTTGKPWLPIAPAHQALAAELQERDAQSVLAWTRRLVNLRKRHAALTLGSMHIVECSDALLVFERQHGNDRVLCAFNLGREPVTYQPSPPNAWRILERVGAGTAWTLARHAALIAERVG